MSSFVADYLAGRTKVDEIDDYGERWHAQTGGEEGLAEFLGLSADEYARWLKDPDSLRRVLSARSSQKVLVSERRR